MNKLTIVILTHRLDTRFDDSLDSALFADKVLVVTNGSQRYSPQQGHQVTTHHLIGEITDFAQARNQTLALVDTDWVFFLDSDEVVPKETAAKIRDAIKNQKISGIWLKRQDIFYGRALRWGEAGGQWLLRIGRREALHFERPVHEVAVIKGQQLRLHATVHHFAHANISEFWQAISSYSQLEAKYRLKQGEGFSLIQLVCYPLGKWIVNYIFKGGLFDGWRGLVYAYVMSCHSLMVRVFIYEATRK